MRATEGSVAIQIVFLVAYFMHSSLKESSCLSFPFPYPILLGFLTVKRPHPPKEMKAYPEQPSGSVMLLLTTKKFSTPNVETLKAFSSGNEQMAANKKRNKIFHLKNEQRYLARKQREEQTEKTKEIMKEEISCILEGKKLHFLGQIFLSFL